MLLPMCPAIEIHLLWLYFTIWPWPFLITDSFIGIAPRPEWLRRMLSTGRVVTE